MASAIGYTRVSTDGQADSGLGLDAQQSAILAAAARHGLTVPRVFTDAGLSGALKLEERPGLLGAIDALRRGDVLLVAKRDRLGRDVLNVAMIERLVARKGARIISAAGEGTDSNDPTSVLMRQIIDAFGEYERAVIGARTKAALRAKRARGERAGGVPFGYRLAPDGVRLVPADDEQRIIARIGELRAAGYSLRAIADELNRQGLVTRSGSPWRHHTSHRSPLLQRRSRECAPGPIRPSLPRT